MSAVNPELAREIARRRTFAIISHPANPLADKPRQHATKN
jgi:peptide subunit release factor RF-3